MEEARRDTYDTTRNLLSQMEKQGVSPKRFVYISTALVLGHRSTNISEEKPGRAARGFRPYVQAKKMTEALLLERLPGEGASRGDPATDGCVRSQ